MIRNSMKSHTELLSWSLLQKEAKRVRLNSDSQPRVVPDSNNYESRKQINCIVYDYSRQRVNRTIIDLLIDLANEVKLPEKIDNLINGDRKSVV